MTGYARALALVLGALALALPGRASAWQSGAFPTPSGSAICLVWQTLNNGTTLSFAFTRTAVVLRLANPGWDLPTSGLYPATIWGAPLDFTPPRELSSAAFKREQPSVIAASLDYASVPTVARAIMNTLMLDIRFPGYRYEANLSGLYAAFERVTPCVLAQTGGYDPFH